MTDHKPFVFRFGEFEVKEREFLLIKGGEAASVEPKAFRVLLFLLRNPGRLVKKDEILNAVWDDCSVSDNSLTRSIATLRRLLGDDPREPRYIATVQTIGYRFLSAVQAIDDGTGKPESPTPEIQDESKNVAAGPQRSDHIAKRSRLIARIVVGGVVLAAGLGFLWLIRERLFGRQQITEQQITRNSNDNPVMNAAISGDGKYLAFSDSHGIHIQLMATGEMRDLAQPAEFHDSLVTWRIHWLPDSTRFLADSVPIGMPPTIWQASVVGGALRKVREDALAMSVSPDGAAVAFTKAWTRELWLMGINGDAPRKLDDAGDHGNYRNVVWSPDGNRLLYIRNDWSASDLRISLETRDLMGGRPITLLTDRRIRSVYWLPDGRILYALGEPGLSGDTCNFWDARVDNKTGQFAAKPSQLTHGAGFCMASISATSDGKQLVFLRRSDEYSVYVADLAPDATRIAPPKHLTMTEGQEFPTAWTVDSQEVIFVSNRNGTWGFYRQGLNGDPAIPIITGIDSTGIVGGTIPRISPDGKWLIYPHFPKNYEYGVNADVLRVPIAGGTPQFILRDYIADTVRCAQAPATICAIATGPDKKHLVFTSFDPVLGRGHELARFEIDPELIYTWAISPDATRIAILKQSTGELHVLSIKTHADHKIAVQHWNNLQSLDWTADGKGLFTSSMQPSGVLLHVDLQGHANILWEPKGTQMPWAIPSPDGRHVAMPGYAQNSNAWMMQNF